VERRAGSGCTSALPHAPVGETCEEQLHVGLAEVAVDGHQLCQRHQRGLAHGGLGLREVWDAPPRHDCRPLPWPDCRALGAQGAPRAFVAPHLHTVLRARQGWLVQGVGSTLEPLAGVGTLAGAVYTCCLVVLVLTQPLPSSSTPPITLTHPPNAAPTRSSSMSEQQGTTNPWPSSASRLPCPMISASMRSCSASSAASCARAKGATGTGRVKSVRYMQNVGSLFSGKVQRHSCMKQPRPHQNLAQRPPRMQEGRAGPANHECTPAKACRAFSVAPAVCAPAFVHDHPRTCLHASRSPECAWLCVKPQQCRCIIHAWHQLLGVSVFGLSRPPGNIPRTQQLRLITRRQATTHLPWPKAVQEVHHPLPGHRQHGLRQYTQKYALLLQDQPPLQGNAGAPCQRRHVCGPPFPAQTPSLCFCQGARSLCLLRCTLTLLLLRCTLTQLLSRGTQALSGRADCRSLPSLDHHRQVGW